MLSNNNSPVEELSLDVGGIKVTGRFRAIVHTGHILNDAGEPVGYKKVLRETPFGRNTITLHGFNRLLSRSGATYLGMVAGVGNTAPTEGDLLLTSYAGKYSSRTITTAINNDIGSGPLYYRLIYTGTFNPGAFGGSPVNIAEAGMAFTSSNNYNALGSGTNIGAHGLLVDVSDNPTTVSVAPDEFLDMVWEYTEWLPYDASGTVSLTIDGVPTDHTYAVRPCFLGNYTSGGGWQPTNITTPSSGMVAFPNTANQNWMGVVIGSATFQRSSAGTNSAIGTPGGGPSGTFNALMLPSSAGLSSYVDDSKQRAFSFTWGPTVGNDPSGINLVTMLLEHCHFQVSFDPPIAKVASKQLQLNFMLTLSNA